MRELKPCPFCGGKATIFPYLQLGNLYMVICRNCNISRFGKSEGEAVKAWNTRANPWHTGTPTEDGYYLCHIQFNSEDYESDEEGYDITYEFKNGSWEEEDENVKIIAWQKTEHYKEKEK